MPSDDGRSRRDYLKILGVAGTAGLAGCIGNVTQGGGSGGGSGGGNGSGTNGSGGNGSGGGSGSQGGPPIPIGSLMPITGQLGTYGKGMQAAIKLAERHINEAGGSMGREIDVTYTDTQTQPSVGVQKYSSLVNEQSVVGVVGAASSGVTTPIAERVAKDQVMEVSHASTSPALAEIGYGGNNEPPKYFGRTAPNDAQQGILMGDIMGNPDYVGADRGAFLYIANPYGEGLARRARESFNGETVAMVSYTAKTNDYSSTLDKLFADDPQAIGFVGYPENGRTILEQWQSGGYGGQWVSSEGINSPSFWEELESIVQGFYVTSPNPETTPGAKTFEEAVGQRNTLFAPHAYDGLFLQALAMHKAGEASGTAIAENIQSVSQPPGQNITVNEFDAAKSALDGGNEINYQGASSPVNLNDALEPLNQYAILRVTNGATETVETIPRSFFEGKL
jgi:branched-chain amino acid transport system substrate-binding protein